MKTAEEILKSKLDGKITFVNNPDYTFNKVIEAMEEYRLQSHPTPMSAEQVEELAEKYADSKYDQAIHLIGWSNTKHGFIAGYKAATTPSVKAEGWVSVEDVERLQSEIHKITGDGEVMMLFNKLLGVSAK